MTSTSAANEQDRISSTEVLVGSRWLAQHLHDSALRVIEVDVSPVAHDEGHIDGAVLWNVYQDLKDPDYRTVDPAAMERLLGRSGIDPDSTVVFYGYAPAMGFWLMKLYGHADARILDCSRQSWMDAALPWNQTVPMPATTRYRLPDDEYPPIRADRSTVHDAIDDPGSTIVDVRTDLEFRGERFWPSGGMEPGGRAGHVPSAINVPLDGIYDAQGSFRSDTELRRLFASIDPSKTGGVVTYCTIGARANRVVRARLSARPGQRPGVRRIMGAMGTNA